MRPRHRKNRNPPAARLRPVGPLRILIQGSDVHTYPGIRSSQLHQRPVNRGTHIIRTGGRYDAHLLIPVIPTAGQTAPRTLAEDIRDIPRDAGMQKTDQRTFQSEQGIP